MAQRQFRWALFSLCTGEAPSPLDCFFSFHTKILEMRLSTYHRAPLNVWSITLLKFPVLDVCFLACLGLLESRYIASCLYFVVNGMEGVGAPGVVWRQCRQILRCLRMGFTDARKLSGQLPKIANMKHWKWGYILNSILYLPYYTDLLCSIKIYGPESSPGRTPWGQRAVRPFFQNAMLLLLLLLSKKFSTNKIAGVRMIL